MLRFSPSQSLFSHLLGLLFALPVLGFSSLALGNTEQGWPRFRGVDGNGISPARNLPLRWAEADFRWRTPLPGKGHSSPVILGDRIFLTCGDPDNAARHIVCVNRADGKIRWSKRYASTTYSQNKDNSYGSASPAVDAHGVFVTWTTPAAVTVVALTLDGVEKWRRDLGPHKSRHGSGISPVVVGSLVWIGDEQEGPSALFGLDIATGEVRHRIERRADKSAYGTPCLFRQPGRPDELVFASSGHGLTSLDPHSGTIRWECGGLFPARVVSSPITSDGLVLCSCGEGGTGRRLVAVRPPADGKPATVVYDLKKGVPNVPTPLAHEGRLYLLNDNGLLRCVRTATGEPLWEAKLGESFYGSPVWAEGRLYFASRKGVAYVIAAADQFEILAKNPLGEASFATPAIADGRLYFRTIGHLVAVGGK